MSKSQICIKSKLQKNKNAKIKGRPSKFLSLIRPQKSKALKMKKSGQNVKRSKKVKVKRTKSQMQKFKEAEGQM